MNSKSRAFAPAALICLMLAASAFSQTTWHVDDDAPNDPGPGDPLISDPLEDGTIEHQFDAIQEAIDACVDGDTVELADGVYAGDGNRDMDFGGRLITVQSANGAANCVIDCGGDTGAHRGLYFHSGETSEAVLEGLTIRNGFAGAASPGGSYGGAIFCDSASSPSIFRCRILDNSAQTGGGVAFAADSNGTIAECEISGNQTGSTQPMWGGGIHCEGSSPEILSCRISGNRALWYGGGISCYQGSSPTISRCLLDRNHAGHGGGALRCSYDCSPSVTNCVIVENDVDGYGGLDWVHGGAGVYCADNSNPVFTNCTIARNRAHHEAAAVFAWIDATPTFTNCIIWGNQPGEIATGESPGGDASQITITHSDVQGGWPGDGNIDVDPGFAFADEWHLAPWSPCIDAGDNNPPGGLPATDFDGSDRLLNGHGAPAAVVDMGAHEFNPNSPSIAVSDWTPVLAIEEGYASASYDLLVSNCGGGALEWGLMHDCPWLNVAVIPHPVEGSDTIHLTIDADAFDHGEHECVLELRAPGAINSPATVPFVVQVRRVFRVPAEYATIQAALDAANVPGDEIVVADGVYSGEGNSNLEFRASPITIRSENGRDNCVIDCVDGGYGFVVGGREGEKPLIEGFTVINGGGVLIGFDGDPVVSDCAMESIYGADMCDLTIRSSTISGSADAGLEVGTSFYHYTRLKAADCDITSNGGYGIRCTSLVAERFNVSGNAGGGISCQSCTLSDSRVTNNSGVEGAGISCGSANIDGCVISGNVASEECGGVKLSGGVISNCIIADNATAQSGGGIGKWHSMPDGEVYVVNCVLAGNSAEWGGGGLYWSNGGSVVVQNSLFVRNTARSGGGISTSGALLELSNSLLIANRANTGFSGGAVDLGWEYGNQLSNSILWGNQPDEIDYSGSHNIVNHCNVAGGWAGIGNIDADPLFVDPDGPDDDPNTWEDNDYRLTLGSPCIDAGDVTVVQLDFADLDGDGRMDERTPLDMDGLPRFIDEPQTPDTGAIDPPVYPEPVDMGPYEYVACLGDLDSDGAVNLSDLAMLLSSYGESVGVSYRRGDLNGDGRINLADLAAMLSAYAEGCD